jgi:hypothetical protein
VQVSRTFYRQAARWCLGTQVLAQGVPPGVPESYRALADYGNVPRSTLHHRARGRPSIEAKAQGEQYLEPCEEDVVVKYLLRTRTALSEGFGCDNNTWRLR